MIGICLREFQSLFKSIKSLIIIIIFVGMTALVANLLGKITADLQIMGINNIYVAGIMIILLLIGPLLVISLSHDILNREFQNRSIRFLVTKTSRDKIVIGKFLGVFVFWFLCMLIAWIVSYPITNHFNILSLIEACIFLSYFIALSLLLSVLISKPSYSIFIGVLCGIAFPIIGFLASFDTNPYIKYLSLLTPYFYYQEESNYYYYLVIILTIILLYFTMYLFRKKDL